MKKENINKLLMIASIGLILSGIIFLIISFIDKSSKNPYLSVSLLCVILANIFSIIRNYQVKPKNRKKKK